MKAYLLYNQATPAQRLVEDLEARLKEATVDTELVDADSPHGIQMVETYDVMARPAVILMSNEGTPVKIWEGMDDMPLVTDVSYLAHQ
jgi:hypothetical protein